ncbi:MAG: tryptophan 2,3-dioxygenase family protein [Planctomycetota bacterium]|nr:tryptophan 2,3-dioxygenase family protein [Planctomycetota bacterium]
MKPSPTTYWDYIRVEELLSLQQGLAADEDEITNEEALFVTVHQVYELWFKLILRDLRSARDLFMAPRVAEQELSGAVERLRRIATIFRVAVAHFEVVETISTRAYLGFRDKLMPASGFQSAQLRQIEVLFGLEEADRIPLGPPGSHLAALEKPGGGSTPALRRVQETMADGPNLREAIEAWLARTPIDAIRNASGEVESDSVGFVERYLAAHRKVIGRTRDHAGAVAAETGRDVEVAQERLAANYERERASVEEFLAPSDPAVGASVGAVRAALVFLESYRELPLLAWPREVLAALLEVEQGFVIFRQRHARMVERVIGRRTGTGGSAGVEYLDKTAIEYRIFKDIWAVRTVLLPLEDVPPLRDPSFYGFEARE